MVVWGESATLSCAAQRRSLRLSLRRWDTAGSRWHTPVGPSASPQRAEMAAQQSTEMDLFDDDPFEMLIYSTAKPANGIIAAKSHDKTPARTLRWHHLMLLIYLNTVRAARAAPLPRLARAHLRAVPWPRRLAGRSALSPRFWLRGH